MEQRPKRTPSFARRIGRSLRDQQKILVGDFLPEIEISDDFDFSESASTYSKVILEIGFGNGEHLATFAQQNPDTLCLGAEPYLNGVVILLKTLKETNINNVRIYKDDVRNLFTKLPVKFLDKVFIICPDPWPKQKQKKRRLINSEFLNMLKTLVKDQIIIATDHLDYARWIFNHATLSGLIPNNANLENFKALPEDWIYTKYQRRGIKLGSDIYYFSLSI